ncbi:MAG: sigma-70 family RNA polymerase sigma factor [Planctomyces sp.]|nr:sigma-70 family RNA polymerase sigma factor [Planctomyces sp.]
MPGEDHDARASEELLPLVYDTLKQLAASKLLRERPGQTLQPTALVHEAYLLLVDSEQIRKWSSRAHFFAAAAESMRRILINSAVRKRRQKHGGELQRVELRDDLPEIVSSTEDLERLDEALQRLEAQDSAAAQIVQLRYFAGLTLEQIAEVLEISPRTVDRRWAYARAWLHEDLSAN